VSPVVHRRHDACRPAADGSARVRDGMRAIGVGLFFHRLYADRRRPHHVTGRTAGGAVKGGVLWRDRRADGRAAGAGRPRRVREVPCCRPMVFLGEISYEMFLIHLVAMELAMVEILHFPIYTGSIGVLFVATFVVTVPA